MVEFDDKNNVLSFDLLNTFPEWFWEGEKVNFKDIQVGVLNNGAFTRLATLSFAKYEQANYEKAGGIVDLPVNAAQANLIRDGLIAFQADPAVWVALADAANKMHPNPSQIILVETPLTAQTDRRSIYLNENESTAFQISVKNKGKPAPGANVLIVKYNPPDAEAGPVNAIPTTAPQVVNITNGQQTVITVTPDGERRFKQMQRSCRPMRTAWSPSTCRRRTPASRCSSSIPISPVRRSPRPRVRSTSRDVHDHPRALLRRRDRRSIRATVELDARSRESVEFRLLRYPLSLRHDLPGHAPVRAAGRPPAGRSRDRPGAALVSPKYFPESTLAMPITRDLSRGKRTVLELWGGLVKRNYPPQPISKPAPPTVEASRPRAITPSLR